MYHFIEVKENDIIWQLCAFSIDLKIQDGKEVFNL
jgi:hypothetical protein